MNTPTTAALLALYREACVMDVVADKPGNVSFTSSGHGMQANDFVRSAQVSAAAIVRREATIGERILSAVAATHDAVGCNTNLGIVLLCAPLIQACQSYPESGLEIGVQRVLDESTLDDADAVYAAVCLASPGGLGTHDTHDVTQSAQLKLADAMRVAAGYDMVARQYANGFAELLGDAVPYLELAVGRYPDKSRAITALYLQLLSRYPDTHIQRKHGAAVAQRIMRRAGEVKRRWADAPSSVAATDQLRDFDNELKESGWNPGTTADFCVAALLSYRLTHLADAKPGVTRNYPRTRSPDGAESAAIFQ